MDKSIFQTAFDFHSNGNFGKASELYLQILHADPDHFDVLHLCGLIAYQTRRFAEAEFFFLKAGRIKHDFAPLYSNYGLTLQALNRFEEAVASYDTAIIIEPDYSDAFNNRGNALKDLGRLDEALASYEKAVLIKPNYADAFNNLGNALRNLGRFDAALESYDKSILFKHDNPEGYNNRGVTLQNLNRILEALSSYEQAIFLRPDHGEAYNNRGNALKDLRRVDEALASYDKSILIDSKHVEAYYNRGVALQHMDFFDDALLSYETAVSINRSYAAAYNNCGIIFQKMKFFDDALARYDRAIAIKPDYAESYNNRGNALREMNRFHDALESYERAISVNKDHAEAYNNRGLTLQDFDHFEQALVNYDKAISIRSDYADAFYNRGYVLKDLNRFDESLASYREMIELELGGATLEENYKNWLLELVSIDFVPSIFSSKEEIEKSLESLDGKLTRCAMNLGVSGDQFASFQTITNRFLFNLNGFYIAYLQTNILEHLKKYSHLIQQALAIAEIAPSPKRRRSGKIRLGLASGLLKSHNGANWAYNWLAQLPEGYEFFTYAFNADRDEFTEKFAALGTHRSLRFGKKAIDMMREDDLDILMLPDVGMTPASRILSCHRIAPIQFTAWGHPVTSGSSCIDYFLSSDLMEPEDAKAHYSETLVRLPNLALYLIPPPPRQTNPQKFDLPEERTLYGCLQSLFKYLPQYDFVFPMIAKEVPGALFVFLEGNASFTTATLKRRLSNAFASCGLEVSQHVKFLPRVSREVYIDLLANMDVILDSIGWTGGNTSLQAIELGKPIVTLPGEFMRGRHTYAMFRMMGLEKHIASSIDDYVVRSVKLASDIEFRSRVETEILERKHLLYEDRSFIDAFDAFLKKEFAQLQSKRD